MPGALADAVLVVHASFILFAVVGSLLWWVWRWGPVIHLPALAWAVYIEWTHGICPLTTLEIVLRDRAGEAGYTTSFIEHYLVPVIYPSGLTATMQTGLAIALLALNLLLYGWIATRRGWIGCPLRRVRE